MYTEPGFGSIVFSEVFLSPAEQRNPQRHRPITAFSPRRYEKESRSNPRPRPHLPVPPCKPRIILFSTVFSRRGASSTAFHPDRKAAAPRPRPPHRTSAAVEPTPSERQIAHPGETSQGPSAPGRES